jgi:hypothetical protein
MTVTFLVALQLDDVSTIADVAADIQDDLEQTGHTVESVKPWARPTLQAGGNPLTQLPTLIEPPPQL